MMPFPANKKITGRFDYHFYVSETGWHAISISARCKSGEQIQKRGGEDLRVEIDGRTFREIPALSKSQYQNIPVSWNGAKLQGAKQTVISVAANTDQLAGRMKRQGNELSAKGGLSPNSERSELRGDTDQLAGRRFIP